MRNYSVEVSVVLLLLFLKFFSVPAFAGFKENSKATLQFKNIYFNRSFKDRRPNITGVPQRSSVDWGQGFTFRAESGYTEGTFGVGLDVIGTAILKLDSGGGRSGTGILISSKDGSSESSSGTFGMRLKAKSSKSVLTFGTHEPVMPVALRSDSRILMQTFHGYQLESKEVDRLVLKLGQFKSTQYRNSTNRERIKVSTNLTGFNGIKGEVLSDEFNYFGADYAFNEGFYGSYYFANLKDNYSQHYFGGRYIHRLSDDASLVSEMIYFDSRKGGNTNIDNEMFGARLTLNYMSSSFGVSNVFQKGKTGMPFIEGGTSPWSFNAVTFHHFLNKGEKSWQAKYDYNFKEWGIPELSLMARYVRGDGYKLFGKNGKEWERDVDISYRFLEGRLSGLELKYRHASYRGDVLYEVDDNRFIIDYTVKVW